MKGKKVFLIIVFIIFLYFIICFVSTRSIIDKMKNVVNGEEIIQDTESLWYPFYLDKKYRKDVVEVEEHIQRIFTACSFDKGFMVVKYKILYFDISGEEVGNNCGYCKLYFERTDGEWELYDVWIMP